MDEVALYRWAEELAFCAMDWIGTTKEGRIVVVALENYPEERRKQAHKNLEKNGWRWGKFKTSTGFFVLGYCYFN